MMTSRKEFAERLLELKRQDWPRLKVEHILSEKDPWPAIRGDEMLTDLVDRYLRHWVPGACPFCGLSRFSWGLVHGAGSCECGWPGRLFHFIDVKEGEIEVALRFDALFWAHPYDVHVKRTRA